MATVDNDFVSSNHFVVWLCVCLGHHVPSVSCLFSSTRARLCLTAYRLITDTFVVINFLTLTVRLLSPDVPLAERSSALLTSITTYQSSVKILFFVLNRGRFQELFDLWNASCTDLPFKDKLKDIQKAEMRRVKVIAVVLLLSTTGPAIGWGLMPFVPFVQHKHGGRFLAVPAWFPFDTLVSPAFELAVVFQTMAGLYVVSKSVLFDVFFMSITALLVGRFKHLNLAMERLFAELDEEPAMPLLAAVETGGDSHFNMNYVKDVRLLQLPEVEDGIAKDKTDYIPKAQRAYPTRKCLTDRDKLMLKIKIWSKHHQEMLILGRKLHEIYSLIFLVQFSTTTVILCSSAFIAVRVYMNAMQYVLSAAFGVGNIVQLYLLCHYGDRLADASVSLSDAGLANGWQHCRVKQVTNCLKIIYQRVQRPLQIIAVSVFPLSAETFFAIMKTAVSYLMVVMELYNQSQPDELMGNDTISVLHNENTNVM